MTTEERDAAIQKDPRNKADDFFEWGDAWVYCDQHLRAHITGWCTVSLRNKTLLAANGHVQAIQECRERGFKLYDDIFDHYGNRKTT